MFNTFNTYGLRSVNYETFNTTHDDHIRMDRPTRNAAITALRIINATLNILGYIPGVSFYSGCVRMAIGVGVIGVTLRIGDRKGDKSGPIIGRFYDEAIGTGIAQIARGALEALIPFGWIINATLDIIATPINLAKELKRYDHSDAVEVEETNYPLEDVNYPFPLKLLHLV